MPAIDVVIPSHEKDFPTLRQTVRSVLRHVHPVRTIHVVANAPFSYPDRRVRWVPEPALPALPSLAEVREHWEAPADSPARPSWFFQQLLKLGAPLYIEDLADSYLVVDSDLVFLRPVSFDPGELGRFPWSRAFEHHTPYARSYEQLFGAPPAEFSLTAHHMLYDRQLLEEMYAEIEQRHGKPWYWVYIDLPDKRESSAISEMDVYGPWVIAHHPELARLRQLQWRDVRVRPGVLARAMYAPDYDFVAAHAWFRMSRARRLGPYVLRVAAELVAPLRARWTSS